MPMGGFAGAVLVLAALGAPGVALLRRKAPFLAPLEQATYGFAVGHVAAALVLLVLACLFGFGTALVVLVAGASTALAAWLVRGTGSLARPDLRPWLRGGRLFAAVVVAALALRWAFFYAGALTLDRTGLWAGHRNLWGDWALHLGDVCSFAYGGNFPPVHPRFLGHAFNYHYLTSISAAALVEVGLAPTRALCLHSFVFSIVIALAVFAFARRLGLGHGAAALALVLFVLGGGLGWWTALRAIVHGQGLSGPLWDAAAQGDAHFRWLNVFFSLIAPQRSVLYGLPLGMLALTLLLEGSARPRWKPFLAAGLVAGLLPFAHLGTLLALALLTPVLFLVFPSRRWFAFFAVWGVVGAPQVLIQQGGGVGAASALRFVPGWVAPPTPWLTFWLLNLGLFGPLLLATFALPDLLPQRSRRFLLAFQPLFVAANLFVFQPWDWDNTKVLVWWYLASCVLVAALLARIYALRPAWLLRPIVLLVVVSLTLSGILENANQMLGRDRHLLLTPEEVELARSIRAGTDPKAVFAIGLQHNHPVSVLTGRRVLTGYPAWLWSQGIDSTERERDLREILTLGPDATSLIARYGIDYVVVGPEERTKLGADPAAWRARYPVAFHTAHYDVFDVRKTAR